MSRYNTFTQSVNEEDVAMDNDDYQLNSNGSYRNSKRWPRNRNKKITQEVRYRVVILGAAGVGKSTIISQFLYGRHPEDLVVEDLSPPTNTNSSFSTTPINVNANNFSDNKPIVELHETHYDVDDTRLTLELLEVTDDETRGPEWQEYVASGDAFVIVYSVSDDKSRNAVSRLRNELLEQHCYLHLPIVVVANKTDADDGTRHVQNVIAEMVAVEEWGHGHTYTSAATDTDSLNSIFLQLFCQVEFPPDHVMKSWLVVHNNKNTRQRKGTTNIFHRLSKRVREFICAPLKQLTR